MRCRESREVKDAEACDEEKERTEGMREEREEEANEFCVHSYVCVLFFFSASFFFPSLTDYAIPLSLLPLIHFLLSADVLS